MAPLCPPPQSGPPSCLPAVQAHCPGQNLLPPKTGVLPVGAGACHGTLWVPKARESAMHPSGVSLFFLPRFTATFPHFPLNLQKALW